MLVVRVVVMVEAGDSRDSGMTSAPPITMRLSLIHIYEAANEQLLRDALKMYIIALVRLNELEF